MKLALPVELRLALVSARKERRWSQAELGRRVGLPQAHISGIEAGRVSPRFNTMLELVRTLQHDLVLVPRQFAPTVRALIEDYRDPDGAESDGVRPLWADDGD